MKIDSSWVLAIIALSAIISPAVVAIFNNRHAENLKEIELLYERNKLNVQHVEKVVKDRVTLLTGFASSLNNFATSHEPPFITTINSDGTQLVEILDDQKRTQIFDIIDAVNSYTAYDSGESDKKLQFQRTSFNSAFPKWMDYIKQLPVSQLPEVPRLRKRRFHLFRTV